MQPLIALVVLALVLNSTLRFVRDYFRVRSAFDNIAGPPSASVWAGNMSQLFNRDNWGFIQNIIETYGTVAKLHNAFGTPALHVYDAKALHSVYVKDQDMYHRGSIAMNAGMTLIGPGLLTTSGPRHKRQRKMLNPVFSVAHMRNLTPLFYNIAGKLQKAIEIRVQDGPKDLDILTWMGRTALELIGQGGLGCSFDPLIEESRDKYTEAVKEFVPSLNTLHMMRFFFPYIRYLGPGWFRRILLDLVPNKKVQRVKYINDTVHQKSKEIYDAKITAIKKGDTELLHTVGEGKDIMSILLKANLTANEEDKLPEDELLAQLATFVVAGVDTTSNALSRILHLLAEHSDVQNKLRSELLEARDRFGEEIPYDELSQLAFMDAICRETLRVHAPINISARQSKQDTILPLAEPIRGVDGTVLNELFIPKDTVLFLNLRACNTNKALWGEDADEWKPERWLNPLPRAVEDARIPGIYAHLMTFISGGNACIGFKFSQLEMKVVLSVLVSSFKFELCNDKPIFWNFGSVAYPAASKGSMHPEMYLKVSIASR